jgi:putative ABC transport system ATP-binding protein
MISVRGLSRRYADGEGGQLTVLDGVDLEVQKGEFVAVTGRSGSGKSTLLHAVGGLDRAYTGEVTVAGTRLTGLPDDALSRFRNAQVGIIFQAFHLVPGLTAKANVALASFFAPVAQPDVEARAQAALERVGLGSKGERLPPQLSGGERQRVAIARALFNRPALLLCDEPTGNLDAKTGDEVIALFRSLHAEGLTLLVVTHEERVSKAASRVVNLVEGKLA